MNLNVSHTALTNHVMTQFKFGARGFADVSSSAELLFLNCLYVEVKEYLTGEVLMVFILHTSII